MTKLEAPAPDIADLEAAVERLKNAARGAVDAEHLCTVVHGADLRTLITSWRGQRELVAAQMVRKRQTIVRLPWKWMPVFK